MSALKTLLNFAADTFETTERQPVIASNPVSQLTTWFPEQTRTGFIPDAKLEAWYKAVMDLENETVRDYLLFVLFTGLKRNEAAKLLGTDINMDSRVISIRKENAHNDRAHKLPLSEPDRQHQVF